MSNLPSNTASDIAREIRAQKLPKEFLQTVQQFYLPLARVIKKRAVNRGPTCVGIQGAQGCGKSTAATFLKLILESESELTVFTMSLDDFYLKSAERESLAQEIHPLLKTRGVPGTHDVDYMQKVFEAVICGRSFRSPVFDKSIDDRLPEDQWAEVSAPVDLILFEGWCVGLGPQEKGDIGVAANELENTEDAKCIWRRYVNAALAGAYADLFKRIDLQIVLQAPSFESVYAWRILQEQKMIDKLTQAGRDTSMAQTPEQIRRFISLFERLTKHGLVSMPDRADWLLTLGEDHLIKRMIVCQ